MQHFINDVKPSEDEEDSNMDADQANDAECIFCTGHYSEDQQQGENWVTV